MDGCAGQRRLSDRNASRGESQGSRQTGVRRTIIDPFWIRNWAINSLRTLLFLVGAAMAAAITFAVIFGDNDTEFDVDDGVSIRHTVRGDSSEFSLREEDLAIKADWRGKLKLDKSGDAIAFVEDYLAIELEEDGARESLRLEKDGRSVEATYWRDGNEQEPGEETDARVNDLVMRFLRASAFEADMRVETILEAGGADAVLDEIDRLTSDYAVRRYSAALSKSGSLSVEQVDALIEKLMRLKGDHDIAQALSAIAEHQQIGDEATLTLLSVAGEIDSDYEKRRVVNALATRPLAGDAASEIIALLSTIDSDHDVRVSIEALLSHAEFTADHAARLIETAAQAIDSDHDLRLVLTKAAPRLKDAVVTDAWLAAFSEVDSDYDKRVALEAAAQVAADDETLKSRLRNAAQLIDSDYDRERALAALK